jgi:hypothetical protein
VPEVPDADDQPGLPHAAEAGGQLQLVARQSRGGRQPEELLVDGLAEHGHRHVIAQGLLHARPGVGQHPLRARQVSVDRPGDRLGGRHRPRPPGVAERGE